MAHFTSTVVTTLNAFSAVESDWNRLINACGESSIHLSHLWLSQCLSFFPPRRILIVLVYDADNNLVGAAPLQITRSGRALFSALLNTVGFIGSQPDIADMMHFLSAPHVDENAIIGHISWQLDQHAHFWDIIGLKLSSSASQLATLDAMLKTIIENDTSEIEQVDVFPTLLLPATIADYERTCPDKRLKKNLKNSINHLQNDFPAQEPRLIFHSPTVENTEKLRRFFDWLSDYWQGRDVTIDVRRYKNLLPFYLSLFLALEDIPDYTFYFSTFVVGETPMSHHVGFGHSDGSYGAHLSYYNTAYKKYRPGVQHMDALIRHTIEAGGPLFEFGRGDVAYKNHWPHQKRAMWQYTAFKTAPVRWLWEADAALRHLKHRLSKKAPPSQGM